jgi:hypothetical protein
MTARQLPRVRVRARLREWVGRYLPAEVTGTLAALAAAWAAHAASGSLATAAVAGAVGESVGYYACMGAGEALRHHANHRHHGGGRRLWLTASRTVRDLLVEFGPAELVDSLAARPFLMYLLPTLLHRFAAGILAGKLAADLVFYSLAVAAYELRKRWLPPRPEER